MKCHLEFSSDFLVLKLAIYEIIHKLNQLNNIDVVYVALCPQLCSSFIYVYLQ